MTCPWVWLVMLAREWLLGMMLSIMGGAFHLRLAQDCPWKSWSVKDNSWPRSLQGVWERRETMWLQTLFFLDKVLTENKHNTHTTIVP